MDININGDHNSVNVVYGDVNNYGGDYRDEPAPIGFLGLAFGVMVLIWLIVKFWWVVLIVASLGALTYGMWLEWEKRRQGSLEAQRRKAALATRAERENSAYLRGEQWGLYGSYPPPPEV
jgi:hypothetical protein